MAPVQSILLSVDVPRRASLPRKCKHVAPTTTTITARAAASKKKKIIPFFSDSTASESGPEDKQDPTVSKPGSYSDDSAPQEGSVSCVPHSAPESVTSLENYTPWAECCYHINTDTCTMSQLKDAYCRLRWFYAHVNRNLDDYYERQQELEAIIGSLTNKIKSLQTNHRAAITKLVNQHRKDQQIWNKITNKYLQEDVALRFATAEHHNQLTNEIRSHYPNTWPESDIPIKQEQE